MRRVKQCIGVVVLWLVFTVPCMLAAAESNEPLWYGAVISAGLIAMLLLLKVGLSLIMSSERHAEGRW